MNQSWADREPVMSQSRTHTKMIKNVKNEKKHTLVFILLYQSNQRKLFRFDQIFLTSINFRCQLLHWHIP